MSTKLVSAGCLYIVATPIGNLGDMVPRAVEVLQSVQLIAAEDTRHSKKLLQHFCIDTPMRAYHDHSHEGADEGLIGRLLQGEDLALISDAGTPLVSDPGYRLVNRALEEGIRVIPIPGASAAIAALSVAGLPSDRFVFEGFLAAKQGARLKQLQALHSEKRTLIFYEAPHRLLDCLQDMLTCFGAHRRLVLARELTKTYETVRRLPIEAMLNWVREDENQQRGECVLLLEGAEEVDEVLREGQRVFDILAADLSLKQAAALAAQISGAKKNALYQYGLDKQA